MKCLSVLVGALMLACSPAVADETGRAGLYEVYPVIASSGYKSVTRATRAKFAPVRGLVGIYAPLAAKAREIELACGSRVISGVRRTYVRGSGRRSLHWTGNAIDMTGNYRCIYRHLQGWPGGYSTDPHRVRHVHISLGGREDGQRFAHYHGRRHTRIAWR